MDQLASSIPTNAGASRTLVPEHRNLAAVRAVWSIASGRSSDLASFACRSLPGRTSGIASSRHPPYSAGHVPGFHRIPDSPASWSAPDLDVMTNSPRAGKPSQPGDEGMHRSCPPGTTNRVLPLLHGRADLADHRVHEPVVTKASDFADDAPYQA